MTADLLAGLLMSAPARSLLLLLVEVSLLLAIAAAAVRLLRDASAAHRHLVWASAMGAVLVLGLGAALPPAWTVEVSLPSLAAVSPRVAHWVTRSGHAPVEETGAALGSLMPADAIASVGHTGVGAWLLILWVGGILVVLARRAGASLWLGRLVRSGTPVTEPGVLAQLARSARRMGVGRSVGLVWLDREFPPATCGVVRPVVLLPRSARGWSRERLELVLAHELIHVSRADALIGLVAELACAVVWMHPGLWSAARRLREERERACDEAVLRHGVSGRTYARELLAIAHECGSAGAAPVLAMAHPRASGLERRVRDLVSGRAPRRPLGAKGALSVVLTTLVTAGALACGEPTGPRDAPAERGVEPRTASALRMEDLGEAGRLFDRASDDFRGDARLSCWGGPAPERGRGHAVIVLFAGQAVTGAARVRLVPERIEGEGAGKASVRPAPGVRCWKAGTAGVVLAGRWGARDVATVRYSADSHLYFAIPGREPLEPIRPPAGDSAFECRLPAGGGAPVCVAAVAHRVGMSREGS